MMSAAGAARATEASDRTAEAFIANVKRIEYNECIVEPINGKNKRASRKKRCGQDGGWFNLAEGEESLRRPYRSSSIPPFADHQPISVEQT